jgi:glutathione S-transferase
VILTYLSDLTGKFKPQGEDERLEALRWIIFDNQKVNGFLGPVPVPEELREARRRPGGDGVPQGPHRRQSRDRRQAARRTAVHSRRAPDHRRPVALRYLYYPADEFGFDIRRHHKNIAAWLDRIKALPGWKHPYELMPGYPPVLA